METVTSKDGTPIAYARSGDGPPLILVHGTTADHTRWNSLLPVLNQHFTVYAMDRRGRGESGDIEPYSLEREYEDVAAVVETVGGPVNLLGHSYGALCAMEAALLTSNLRKLVLYEPVFPTDSNAPYQPGARERLQALLDQGDRELLLMTFFRDIVQLSAQELASLRTDPSWEARLAGAHTIVREMADADYIFDPRRFRQLQAPTLLLIGGNSLPDFTAPTRALAAVLPSSRVVVMPGQAHVAMNTAPELFLREVIDFLTE